MSHRRLPQKIAVLLTALAITFGAYSPAFSSPAGNSDLDLKFPWPADLGRCVRLNVGYESSEHLGWQDFGLDFDLRDEPVAAAVGGTVVFSELGTGFNIDSGEFIVIQTADGIRSLYAHLSERYVEKGDEVQQGEIIGRSGRTGRASGRHLHFHLYRIDSGGGRIPIRPEPMSGVTGLNTGQCYTSDNVAPGKTAAEITDAFFKRVLDGVTSSLRGYCVGLNVGLGNEDFPFAVGIFQPKDSSGNACSGELPSEAEEKPIFEAFSRSIRLSLVGWWIN